MNLGVLVITFLGVNFDFFFMLLFLLKKYQISQVIVGYLIGVITRIIHQDKQRPAETAS